VTATPPTPPTPPPPPPGRPRSGPPLVLHLLFIAALFFLLHWPTLHLGRLRDDIYVLDKCEALSWRHLLLEGFRFPIVDFGNPWWMVQPDVCHFFRPLVLTTFKLPIALFGSCDTLHRVGNLVIHLLSAGLLLLVGRRLFRSTAAALFAACWFTFSLHNQWTVMWLVARKELLVGLLVLTAFYAHLRSRRAGALVAFFLALTAGEHAVAFPFIAVLWDCLGREEAEEEEETAARLHLRRVAARAWPTWAAYFALLVTYVVARHVLLGGLPLPPAPYFTHPLAPGAFAFYGLKKLQFLAALTAQVPFFDRPVMTAWLNHPSLLVLCVAASLALLAWAPRMARDRRLFWRLAAVTLMAFMPFTPMVAMPIYLYTPMLFASLTLGAALDGILTVAPRKRRQSQRGFLLLVMAALTVHVIGAYAWVWGPFNATFAYPLEQAPIIAELVRSRPDHRRLLLVDVPPFALALPHLLQKATGLAGPDIAVVTMLADRQGRGPGAVLPAGPRSFRVVNDGVPYFDDPTARALGFVPDGVIRPGATFDRGWFRVTLERLGPEPATPGDRFFTHEPGVAALRVDLAPGEPPPVVIAFRNLRPCVVPGLFER